MSKLEVQTVGQQAGASQDSLEGLCKVWANLDGTGTIALNDSFNVDSVTDNGTGDYTCTFTANMANANYGTAMGKEENSGGNGEQFVPNGGTYSTSQVQVHNVNSGGSNVDVPKAMVSIHGDLAV